jgi:hypothetical protein
MLKYDMLCCQYVQNIIKLLPNLFILKIFQIIVKIILIVVKII